MGQVIISTSDNSLGLTAQGIYGTSLLVGHGYAVFGGVQFGNVYPLNRTSDAEALGITKAADAANNMLVWYHIDEFFRTAPGTQLYLYIVAPTAGNTLSALLDQSSGPLPAVFNEIGGAELLVGVFNNMPLSFPREEASATVPIILGSSDLTPGNTIYILDATHSTVASYVVGSSDTETSVAIALLASANGSTFGSNITATVTYGIHPEITIYTDATGWPTNPAAANGTYIDLISNSGVIETANYSGGVNPVTYDPWTDLTSAGIPKANELAIAQAAINQPCVFLLEGRALNGTSTTASSLRTSLASWVGVVVAQDMDIAASNSAWTNYAAVATALGVKAAGRTSRNIGYVAECNIQDTGRGRWLNPGLSSGVSINTLSTNPISGDYVSWLSKGYIVPRVYNAQSTPGVYFDSDPSCDALTSNYNRLANSHTYVKAARLVFNGVAPLINWDVLINPSNGQLSAATCAIYESAGNDQLAQMLQASEISGYQTKVDPNQNVQETQAVQIGFEIVPKGNAGTIKGTITFVQQLTNL